jgi:hypothetical protein
MQAKGVLQELQSAIKANRGYVLGSFTYADIVMAVRPCSPSMQALRRPKTALNILSSVSVSCSIFTLGKFARLASIGDARQG